MLLTLSSVGWRFPGSEDAYERTTSLRPPSHLELSWVAGASSQMLTKVWASVYVEDSPYVHKLVVHQMDARALEWRFTFQGEYQPLYVTMEWNAVDEETGEITLINQGVARDLLEAIGAERPA